MDFSLFINELQVNLQPLLPSSADTEINEDDGTPRIFIRTPSDLICTGIPLKKYFDEYSRGCPLEEICSRILEVCTAATLQPFCTVGDLPDKTTFLKGLELRPLSLQHYKKLMPLYPHEVRCGMLFFYTVGLQGTCGKLGKTLVTPELLRAFRVRETSLFDIALSNMRSVFKPLVRPLPSYLGTLSERSAVSAGLREDNKHPGSFRVLTNSGKRFGACCLFYPGLTEELYRHFGTYYILPSSVHEVLILPTDDAGSLRDLKLLIRSVNSAVNDTLLILSDELYAYDPQKGLHIV